MAWQSAMKKASPSFSQQSLFGFTEPKTDSPALSVEEWALYTDGSSLGNPGPGGGGIILLGPNGRKLEKSLSFGVVTNNEAEYWAVICGMHLLCKLSGKSRLTIYTDSELVGKQLMGIYKVKNLRMQELCSLAQRYLKGFAGWTICNQPREAMTELDRLAKMGSKANDPSEFEKIRKEIILEGFSG